VSQLETLETVTALGLFADYIKDRVDEFSTFGVMTFSPVITSSRLSENEVVGSEYLTERTGSDGVHGAGLKINKDSSGDIFATGGFIVVHVDPLELEIGVTMVGTGGVNTVLIGDDLPEFRTDLVTALTGL